MRKSENIYTINPIYGIRFNSYYLCIFSVVPCRCRFPLIYDFKQFNAYIQKKKKITGNDVVSICKVLKITPNELFGYSKKENTIL